MKTPREDHVSKAYFDYRCRTRSEHFADLAVVSDDHGGAEHDGVIVNVDLSHALRAWSPALPVAVRFKSRFEEIEHSMIRILNRPGHIRAADGSVVGLDLKMGRHVGTYYRPNLSVRAVIYGSLAEVQTGIRGWIVAEDI